MASYYETKETLFVQRVYSSIEGVPLDVNSDKSGWFPISPCICVTEPCPCDTLDDIIVWLPKGIKSVPTGNKYERDAILSFQLTPETNVLVETQIPMTVAQLHSLKATAERQNPRTMSVLQKSASKKGKKPGIGALLIGAFELGWHIGEKIDEETGLSDKISDWAAENFPWPWR